MTHAVAAAAAGVAVVCCFRAYPVRAAVVTLLVAVLTFVVVVTVLVTWTGGHTDAVIFGVTTRYALARALHVARTTT